jgi:hypothetical protein
MNQFEHQTRWMSEMESVIKNTHDRQKCAGLFMKTQYDAG